MLIFHWFFRPLANHSPKTIGKHCKKKAGNTPKAPEAHHRRVSLWRIWSDSFDLLKNPASKSY